MAARLKVFTWSDGFHRYTVATSSRAKALAAWGFHRDLFQTGDAQEVTSGDDHDQALAHPGVSVERGLSIDAGMVALKTAARPRPGPSAADRERVGRLEAQLKAAEQDHDDARADLERRIGALQAEAERLEAEFGRRRADLAAELDQARRRLR
ncbi:MAG: hypothetical protein JWO72_957 [Caulobacteraceae bacterium]|nr:hypothetical protein [Caulobacteraceae bacterium]